MTEDPSPPPPVLMCARVIEFAVLDESVRYSGRTSLYVDGKELGAVPCLAICVDTDGVLLLHCDSDWNALGYSGHRSVEEAKQVSERIYAGLSACWKNPQISPEQAEKYLDDVFKKDRCSFCGRRPDQVQQMIQKESVRICDRCVSEFQENLRS
jgi:hypothetical protein